MALIIALTERSLDVMLKMWHPNTSILTNRGFCFSSGSFKTVKRQKTSHIRLKYMVKPCLFDMRQTNQCVLSLV